MFSIVQPPDEHGLPAYQCFTGPLVEMGIWWSLGMEVFFPFVATLLELSKSSSTWASLTSLEDWWTRCPDSAKDQETRTQMEQILVTTRQQLAEVSLGFFQELPMAGSWMDE